VLTLGDVGRLRKAYAILENVAIRIPDADSGVKLSDKTHKVCVYDDMLRVGVQFLLLLVVHNLLVELHLAPSQIKPNGW
jgi:hypothetical protein